MERFVYMFYFFFQGIVFFQVLFLVSFYAIVQKKDSLYFGLFLFFVSCNFFISAPEIFYDSTDEIVLNSWWFKLLNTPLVMSGSILFTLFLREFFGGLINNRTLTLILKISLTIQLFMFIPFIVLYLAGKATELIFNIVNFVGLASGVWIATIIIRKKMPYANLVVAGFIFFITGSFLTSAMLIMRLHDVHHLFTDTYPLFFVKCGLLIQMICYLVAIIKKWHFQEKQLSMQKLESALLLEKMRNRISSELHDDIGSTLSGISMYSHMAKSQSASGEKEKVDKSLQVIQQSANEMVDKLKDIVWSVNPREDSLEQLFGKIEEYAIEMTASKQVKLELEISQEFTAIKLPMENRHNIYLFCKEAINNAMKYSKATLLELKVRPDGRIMEFMIKDNGIGFDPEHVKRGNGLDNMQKRADEIGAKLVLHSKLNEGTYLSLQCEITH
jgi:signal transduction histidine kinase